MAPNGCVRVIEWTLELTMDPAAGRELIRGAEWYVFRDDRIAEIRAYYDHCHREARTCYDAGMDLATAADAVTRRDIVEKLKLKHLQKF